MKKEHTLATDVRKLKSQVERLNRLVCIIINSANHTLFNESFEKTTYIVNEIEEETERK